MKKVVINKETYEVPEAVLDTLEGLTAKVLSLSLLNTAYKQTGFVLAKQIKDLKTAIKKVNAINLTGQSQMCCVGLLHTIKKILGEIK